MSERPRVRGIRFTDSDWERVRLRAQAAGMPIQEYAHWQLLERPTGSTPAPTLWSDSVQGQMARALIVLFERERRRVAGTQEEAEWKAIVAEVESWLEREERLG